MALTSPVSYSGAPNYRPSGQVITLPGSSIFTMPHALPDELDFYTIDTIQQYPLGTKLEIGDNTFRYVEYGGTTKAGDLLSMEAPDAAHDDLDPTGTGSGAGVTVGEKIISFADTITLVQDEYAGGYMVIEADTGVGYAYLIESNDAAASNALFRIKLGLAVALDSTSDVTLVKSRYKELVIMPTTIIAAPAGVGVGVGADGSFGWMATRGPWSVLTSGTLVIGEHARAAGVTTAGAVIPLNRDGTDEDEAEIGIVINVGPTTEQSLIALRLD